MRLVKGAETVTLLFSEVHQLAIDEDYTGSGCGMEIHDCSSSGMEMARVRVGSFEPEPAIRFWARDVERLVDDAGTI